VAGCSQEQVAKRVAVLLVDTSVADAAAAAGAGSQNTANDGKVSGGVDCQLCALNNDESIATHHCAICGPLCEVDARMPCDVC